MTPLTTKADISPEDHQIAALAALAIALSVMESVIPLPLPGVKPGVANIVTLYVLCTLNFSAAFWVSLLRVVASSLILGNFLSPGFFLGLSGMTATLLVLYCAQQLPKKYFSAVSLSLLAALGHISGQLLLVRVWLIPHAGVIYLIPVFIASALFFGLVNGMITSALLEKHAAPRAD